MTTPPRARQVGGDSLWLAAGVDERAADQLWLAPDDRIARWSAHLRIARQAVVARARSGTRIAQRLLPARLAQRSLPARIGAVDLPARIAAILQIGAVSRSAAVLRERIEELEAGRGASALPLSQLGFAIGVGFQVLGSVALWLLSGGTASLVLAEVLLLPVGVAAAVAACGFVVRRERSSSVRRRYDEEERAEVAASFLASDWRRRIGGR